MPVEKATDLSGAHKIPLPRHAAGFQAARSCQPDEASKPTHLLLIETWDNDAF
jgi:hypothetical protein